MRASAGDRTPVAARPSELRIPAAFSPELRLLLGALRCALGTGEASEIDGLLGGVDWASFAACARRHRVGAFLHHRLPAAAKERLPEGSLAEFARAAERAVQRGLVQSAELVRIARALEEAGVGVTSVKGPLLAVQLYGELGQRHSGDLDLVVAQAEVERADAVLQAKGYRRTEPDFVLTPRQQSAHLHFHRENEYLNPSSGFKLELKWRLYGPTGGCGAEREWREVAGSRVATLAPGANAIYLFAHGARHGWFRLFWLVDVALLLQDDGVDWAEAAENARRSGVRRSLLQGAVLARDLMGVPMPPALARLSREQGASLGTLASRACGQISKEVRPGSSPAEPIPYMMLLQEGWRSRWAILQGRFMYAKNWRILPLPDRWFALHYPAAPILWLYRRIAPRRGDFA
jgi:hypothetical protein